MGVNGKAAQTGTSDATGRGFSGPLALLRAGATGWMRRPIALAIVLAFFLLSVGPLWLGNLADPKASSAKGEYDPFDVLEPLVGSPISQVFARTSRTLLSAPSVRPVLGPTKTPWPYGFWTPERLYSVSIASWMLGVAALPFFIRAATGLPLELGTGAGWARMIRALVAIVGVRFLASLPGAVAFRTLPEVLGGTPFVATPGFVWLQNTVDGLSIVPIALLFLWPYACAVHDLDLVDGAVWTAFAWRRRWRWVLPILLTGLVLRLAPPAILAFAKAAGALHWTVRLALRTAGAGFRFWLDGATCGVWALLACALGPSARRDPRLVGGQACPTVADG